MNCSTNSTSSQDIPAVTLVELLQWRMRQYPDKIAYTFLVDGDSEERHITYRALDHLARTVAAHLQTKTKPGDRALLLYPAGLDFIIGFFGCLYAGIVAVPAYPPRRNRPDARLEAILLDAQPTIVLTTQELFQDIEQRATQQPAWAQIEWLVTDDLSTPHSTAPADVFQPFSPTPDTLALMQYTSGSTGTPKGVMVNHANLLYNEQMIANAFDHNEETIVVGWLPLFHDMGLIGNTLQPIYLGATAIFMSPVAFLQKPMRWLKAISRYRATTSGGPNFAYELCVQKFAAEQALDLNLSSWRVAYNGAEPVRAETLERFTRLFAPYGFRKEAFLPVYGLAEATLFVAGGNVHKTPTILQVKRDALAQNIVEPFHSDSNPPEQSQLLVSCGHSWLEQKIAIVHPETGTPVGEGEVGEIWVTGPNIAQGYWQKAAATAETFRGMVSNTPPECACDEKRNLISPVELMESSTSHSKLSIDAYLRTGDLGFMQADELFVTGRIKDLIIIRGRNHYPHDIEETVAQCHPALEPTAGAVFTIETEGAEQLIILQEVKRTHLRHVKSDSAEVEEIFSRIRRAVTAEHDLLVHEIVLLRPATILKTSSGKIKRRACRDAFLNNHLKIVVSSTSTTQSQPPSQPQTSLAQSSPLSSTDSSTESPTDLSGESKISADRLIGWLQDYAKRRINSRMIDERRCIPPYIAIDFGNQGMLGLQIPKQYGGLALNNVDALRVFEQLAAIDLTLTLFAGNHHALGTRPILNYAQPAMRDKYLPRIAQGRELAAFALTEPGAGSNPRAIAATATPVGADQWRLRGQKVWIGSGSWAGIINVFAQLLDKDGRPLEITAFTVPAETNGLVSGPEALTLGIRGMVQNSIYLNDVLVGVDHILGKLGQGMTVAQDAMMFGRLGLGMTGVGGMKRCAQLMHRYAERRTISTGRLLDNPVTLVRLSTLTAKIAAVETLTFRIAHLLDQDKAVPEEAYAICKIAGPEFLYQAADHLVQLLGGRGAIETNVAPQLLRDARLLRIFEGPTETLLSYLGSRLVNSGGTFYQFLREDLNAPSIAEQLQSTIADICNQHQLIQQAGKARMPAGLAATRWRYYRIGELTTFATLWAGVHQAYRFRRTDDLYRAVEWAKGKFEEKRTLALTGMLPPGLAEAEVLSQLIGTYSETLGQLEQTLAGEDHRMDELLLATPPKAPMTNDSLVQPVTEAGSDLIESANHKHITTINSRPNGSNRGTLHYTDNQRVPGISPAHASREQVNAKSRQTAQSQTAQIQMWLIAWLSHKLKMSSKAIQPHKAFADYGIDSVMAVELVQDLEDWLVEQGWVEQEHFKLETTLTWNYPTIGDLADFLAREATQATIEPAPHTESSVAPATFRAFQAPSQNVNSSDEPSLESVSTLSELELMELLAAEIAANKEKMAP